MTPAAQAARDAAVVALRKATGWDITADTLARSTPPLVDVLDAIVAVGAHVDDGDLCDDTSHRSGDGRRAMTRRQPREAPLAPLPRTLDAPPAPAPWDERHQREANARTYEIAAELHRRDWKPGRRLGDEPSASYALAASDQIATENDFIVALTYAGLDATRIDREVRRVRDLAEGRVVRDTTWRAGSRERGTEYDNPADARKHVRNSGLRMVKVTRIRRVPQ